MVVQVQDMYLFCLQQLDIEDISDTDGSLYVMTQIVSICTLVHKPLNSKSYQRCLEMVITRPA